MRGIADLPCFGVELAAVVERVPAFFCRHHCGKIGIVEEPTVEDGVRCCGRTVATSERRGRTRVVMRRDLNVGFCGVICTYQVPTLCTCEITCKP